jgi:hypothetical protein
MNRRHLHAFFDLDVSIPLGMVNEDALTDVGPRLARVAEACRCPDDRFSEALLRTKR